MKNNISVTLVILLICSIFVSSTGSVYAGEVKRPVSEKEFVTEQSAEVPDWEDIATEAEDLSENADSISIPDNTFDTPTDTDALTDEDIITEDAEEIDSAEEVPDEQTEGSSADPIDDSCIDDIHQTDEEALSGSSEYTLQIVWLDGGSREFSLGVCKNLKEAEKQAGILLKKLSLSERCTITVDGNTICSKIQNPADISSNIAVIAHMGFCKSVPENTLSSIRMAAALGFKDVEFDVRFTKDGIPVLLHDETINNYGRYEDGKVIEEPIYVRELTYEELQNYDFGIRKGQMWKGEKAPALDSALEICAESGLRPNLDIKSDGRMTREMIHGISSLVEKYNLQGRAAYLSNIMWYLKTFAHTDPASNYTYILYNTKEGYIEEAEQLKNLINGKLYFYVHDWNISEAVERTCRFHNIPLMTAVASASRIANLDRWVKAIEVTNILPETVIKEAEKRVKNFVISYDGEVRDDRNYCIYASRNCGFNVHSEGGTVESRILMWDGSGRKELNDFRFEPVSGDLYRIISTDSMLALSTNEESQEVVLRLPSDDPAQLWQIQKNSNRTYTFINVLDGRSLHAGVDIAQGDALMAAEPDQSSAEQFFLSHSLTRMPGGDTGDTRSYSDVQDTAHPYYTAVYWASWRGITKGFDDGSFGLNTPCTRGQAIMFLWRYAGKPAPKVVSASPFKDVAKNHAFYKAVLWANQEGITKGYSDGTFGITRRVSRGEFMMFLWRLKGKSAPKTAVKSPFRDVPATHSFYKAILWGAQKKITTGYTTGAKKGMFGMNDACTRGAIVAFLYRARSL